MRTEEAELLIQLLEEQRRTNEFLADAAQRKYIEEQAKALSAQFASRERGT